MKFIQILSILIITILPSGVVANPSKILGRLPFITDLQISPKGDRIAYLEDIKGKYHIVSKKLFDASSKPVIFALSGDSKIREISWGNNEKLLFWATSPYFSKADAELFTMQRFGILSTEDGEVIWPFKSRRFNYNIGAPRLVNKLAEDPEHVIISNYYTSVGRVGKNIDALYKVELDDGDREEIFSSYSSSRWLTDKEGDVVVYLEFSKKYDANLWKYRKNKTADFVELVIKKGDEHEHFDGSIRGISEDRKTIHYFAQDDNNFRVMMKAQIINNEVVNSKQVSKNGRFDTEGFVRQPLTGQLGGVYHIADYPEYKYFDKKIAQVHADLKATFPNAEVQLTSYSTDQNRYIAKVSGSEYPIQYFFYDVKAGELALMAEGFPKASKLALGKVSLYQYKTSDDLTIDAYLTIPKTKTSKKLPLIVIPHGGPESRNDGSFDWVRQFFAVNGYVVFQPNFRGSSGYGTDFVEAGNGEWGKKMQQDIDEGVKSLIEAGTVDPDKICVVGSSYGGYVALYSATARQSLYKCGVSFGGISDLDDILYHAKEQKGNTDYWEKSIGERTDQEFLKKHSPLFLVSKSTRPILLFHGDNDTVVPSFQSKNMYKALKKAKVKGSRYIEMKNEDHWLTNGDSRQIYLEESLKFVKQHLD